MSTRRRSRMHRTPTGKHLMLSERDIEIFRALARYRYLRSTYLYAFAGGASETRFKERLGDLFHEGYLDRPESQWQFAEARFRPVVYELGSRARRALSERGIPENPRTFLSAGAHRQFAHAVMICECLASIELAVKQCEDIRFIAWPEIVARAPESTRLSPAPWRIPAPSGAIVPDGLFGLEYLRDGTKTYRFFALEADRGTMPVARSGERGTSLAGKLAAYRGAIARQLHRSHLGVPNLLVLTVTPGAARLQSVLGKFNEHGGPAFLFKAVEPQDLIRPVPNLLREPWLRVGLPPLRIGESGCATPVSPSLRQ